MSLRDKNGLTEAEFLASYRVEEYPRPSVACDMVVFTITQGEAASYRRLPEPELQVLLIQRGGHPCLGSWALPGGFVRPGWPGCGPGTSGGGWAVRGLSGAAGGIQCPWTGSPHLGDELCPSGPGGWGKTGFAGGR